MKHFLANYLMNPNHEIKIALIGCGGNGSRMLTSLASINEALISSGRSKLHVYVIDNDKVSVANIGRQSFSLSDVGLSKSEVLVTRVNRYFGIEWESLSKRYSKAIHEDIKPNIVITCVDSVKSRKQILSAIKRSSNDSYKHNKLFYWMDLGNGNNYGQVILATHGEINQPNHECRPKLPNFFEEFGKMDDVLEDDSPSCSLAEALEKQGLFVNSFVTLTAAEILYRLLKEKSIEIRGAYINVKSLIIKTIPV